MTIEAAARNLLWLGVEDCTGLWQAAIEVRTEPGVGSAQQAQDCARHILERLLSRGWMELYVRHDVHDTSMIPIAHEERASVLADPANWVADGPWEGSVWFGTTDAGHAAYADEIPLTT